jgi:hypothetical protein
MRRQTGVREGRLQDALAAVAAVAASRHPFQHDGFRRTKQHQGHNNETSAPAAALNRR